MDTLVTTVEPYLGTWTGPAPALVGGDITVTVVWPDPQAEISGTVEIEAAGQAMAVPAFDMAERGLRASLGPIEVELDLKGTTLHARIRSELLPNLDAVLKRGPILSRPAGSPAGGAACERLDAAVRNGDLPWVDSLTVLKDGQALLAETYGRGPESLRSLQSATKSITSLLMGCLVDGGHIDVAAPVAGYLPGRRGTHWIDEGYDITIHEMLAMSAGLDWNEQTTSYLDPENDAVRMNAAPDWIGYVLDRPLAPARRGVFEYHSGLSLLMGEVIAAVSGDRVDRFARERLFEPMGVDEFHWMTGADGTVHTGGGLWLRPADFAKFGQLVLDHGRWNDGQLISAEWIETSTSPQSRPLTPPPTAPAMAAYGYQWWLLATDVEGGTIASSCARGHGGQVLQVVPHDRTVIAMTGRDWLGGTGVETSLLQLFYGGGA